MSLDINAEARRISDSVGKDSVSQISANNREAPTFSLNEFKFVISYFSGFSFDRNRLRLIDFVLARSELS